MASITGRYGKRLFTWGAYGSVPNGEIQITMRGPSGHMDWDDRFDAAEALRFFLDAAAEIAKLLHPPPAPPATNTPGPAITNAPSVASATSP